MATLTGSMAASTVVPRGGIGLFNIVLTHTSTGTISAGDTVLLGKIATGITILDGYITTESAATETNDLGVGIGASLVNLLAQTSSSTGALVRFAGPGLPYTVSVSDDAAVRFEYVKVNFDGEFSTTAQIKLVLFCTCDP